MREHRCCAEFYGVLQGDVALVQESRARVDMLGKIGGYHDAS